MQPREKVRGPELGAPRRYRRAPVPVHFPSEEEVPETKRHLELRTALYQLLKAAFAERAWIGSDQFVYWDPTDPNRRLAPDVLLRRGGPDDTFDNWKVWERGAPEIAVEIVSRSDRPDLPWNEKLERYRRVGVTELVRFDPEATQEPLRVWDRVEGDLVEREPDDPRVAECGPLEAWWVVVSHAELGPMLRLARDRTGRDLFPTPDEQRQAAERERQAAERERDVLVSRIRELERQLGEKDR